MAGVFIDVEVTDEVKADPELAQTLSDACPVNIYAATAEGLDIVEENLDECILCRLCVDAAPPGGVKVVKVYDDGATLER